MGKKIMIVDDDPDILITVRELFEPLGYEVFTIPTGKDCLYELRHGFKGVILMDIMMPIMSGWDTIRKIIKENLYKDNTISMLTAKDTPDPELGEFKNYIKDYIVKPFKSDDLIKVIEGYFSSK